VKTSFIFLHYRFIFHISVKFYCAASNICAVNTKQAFQSSEVTMFHLLPRDATKSYYATVCRLSVCLSVSVCPSVRLWRSGTV